MAAATYQFPKCNGEWIHSIYCNAPPTRPLRGTNIAVAYGPPSGSMEFVGTLPQKNEVHFPVERFVTYEPSDAAWAVPLGIARVVPRNIRPDDVVEITYQGDSMEVQIAHVGLRGGVGQIVGYVVEFFVLSFLTKR